MRAQRDGAIMRPQRHWARTGKDRLIRAATSPPSLAGLLSLPRSIALDRDPLAGALLDHRLGAGIAGLGKLRRPGGERIELLTQLRAFLHRGLLGELDLEQVAALAH